jgi:hypothetical protein
LLERLPAGSVPFIYCILDYITRREGIEKEIHRLIAIKGRKVTKKQIILYCMKKKAESSDDKKTFFPFFGVYLLGEESLSVRWEESVSVRGGECICEVGGECICEGRRVYL